jgi:hypothetical protein
VIWLQIPKVFNVNEVNVVKQTKIYSAEPLVPEPIDSEVEMTTGES